MNRILAGLFVLLIAIPSQAEPLSKTQAERTWSKMVSASLPAATHRCSLFGCAERGTIEAQQSMIAMLLQQRQSQPSSVDPALLAMLMQRQQPAQPATDPALLALLQAQAAHQHDFAIALLQRLPQPSAGQPVQSDPATAAALQSLAANQAAMLALMRQIAAPAPVPPATLPIPSVGGQPIIVYPPLPVNPGASLPPGSQWAPIAGAPKVDLTPSVPGAPKVDLTPGVPGAPKVDLTPSVPGAPKVDVTPSVPGAPKVDATPSVPGAPKITLPITGTPPAGTPLPGATPPSSTPPIPATPPDLGTNGQPLITLPTASRTASNKTILDRLRGTPAR
jgi:hypothetical protein